MDTTLIPLTEKEKKNIIKHAGPFRVIQWTFARFNSKGRVSPGGTLRVVGARILSNYEAKQLGE